MFGFFMFGQPLFGDVPVFPVGPGGGGSSSGRRSASQEAAFENQIEAILISFLNTQA